MTNNKNWVGIVLMVALLAFAFYIIWEWYDQQKPVEEFGSPKKTVVIFKTHIWNDSIEKFANKLMRETQIPNVDFFILIHNEKGKPFNQIKNANLKRYVLTFTENEIKAIYPAGFFGMWLSNHWILMWFYKQHRKIYDYFWTIEYDVRISGDSKQLWTYRGSEDYVYPIEIFQDPNWGWRNHYVGGKLMANDKFYGYLQLARYSNRFLHYLDECFGAGENGQDEMIMFSLLVRGKFSGNHKFLSQFIEDSWSVDSNDSDKHKVLLTDSDAKAESNRKHLRIFHPIK